MADEPSAEMARTTGEPSQAAEKAAETTSAPTVVAAAPASPPPAEPAPDFVYALGQVDWRFPTVGIEKEFAQAAGRPDYAGRTDREAVSETLSAPENRYLARQCCWTFVIEGLETYILVPRDSADLQLLIDAIRAEPSADDLDAVIGVRGGIAGPEFCNGLAVPIVAFDQLYSFDRQSLITAIPRPDSVASADEAKFRSAAGGFFDELRQLADNAGATDEHRALNYLTVRYPRIYGVTAEQYERNFSFTGVEVRQSPLGGARSIVDVIFSYTHRETDVVEKQSVRVDVTEEFPFLVTKMGPFYER
jgi:hypothetical protein